VVGAGAELHLLHGGFEQLGAGLVQLAEFTDFGGSHPTGRLRTVGVGLEAGLFEAVSLDGAGFFDPLSHFGTGFTGTSAAEFVERDMHASVSIQSKNGDYSLIRIF
jgi:hypothetical protein